MPIPEPAQTPGHPPASDRLIPFAKLHANGNDFLVIEEAIARNRHAELARKLCHRTEGIGADGIEFLHRRADNTLFLRLFNADGSEAELSGNGTRCVAAWLAATESLNQVTFETHGGKRACEVLENHDPRFLIRSSMGIPRVMPRSIDLPGIGIVAGAMVNVGNPHFVILLEEASTSPDDFTTHNLPWQQLGERIATSPLFRHGTNVEFVRIVSPAEIHFRIYERGCGPTKSSGTGTCASAAAAMSLRSTARELTAVSEGGSQLVSWTDPTSEMHLIGPAQIVCRGEVSAF